MKGNFNVMEVTFYTFNMVYNSYFPLPPPNGPLVPNFTYYGCNDMS
jgi:hypothetical protein